MRTAGLAVHAIIGGGILDARRLSFRLPSHWNSPEHGTQPKGVCGEDPESSLDTSASAQASADYSG